VVAAVRDPAAGGLVVFVGSVRDLDGGRAVERLGYTAHPSAEAQLRAVAESVAARYPAVAVAAVHRVGDLDIGDVAVVVAVSCPHRGEAFDAARALIDELKTTVPIWKHQVFSDGSDEWVGTP
jgi:molybdopterin synthase catalytic subunit